MLGWLRTKTKMAALRAVHALDHMKRKKLPRQGQIPPEAWDLQIGPRGTLIMQGCDLVALAQQYGTPLYVVDNHRLRSNYLGFRDSFRTRYPNVEIAYSYKTNPLPGVLKALHQLGASAEVISHFELWLALKLNTPPDKIIYNGPGKTEESLKLAVSNGIKLINIDALDEVELIDRMARAHERKQQVGVRVVTSVGWSSQFGLGLHSGAALRAFQELATCANVIPCALHIHLGTGIKDIAIYLRAIQEVLDFSLRLERDLGIHIKYFDFGGGFGVPTVWKYSALDSKLLLNDFPPMARDIPNSCPSMEDYAQAVTSLFRRYHPQTGEHIPTLIFEPGRAVTSSAQCLLLKVLRVKPHNDRITNVILDGGKNLTMPLGYEYHEGFLASRMNAPLEKGYYNLYGPLCHPSDILFRAKKFPLIETNDLIAIMDVGAYFVPNQMNFSNPRPSAVLVENGKHQLLRSRESCEDVIALAQL